MDDASGRFTNGFYWGNSYYVGSASECEFISEDTIRNPIASADKITEVEEFNAEPHKKRAHGGLSRIHGTIDQSPSFGNGPPYPLGFFTMRIMINSTMPPLVIISKFKNNYTLFIGII